MCDNDVRVGFKDFSSCPFYVVDWVEGARYRSAVI